MKFTITRSTLEYNAIIYFIKFIIAFFKHRFAYHSANIIMRDKSKHQVLKYEEATKLNQLK